MTTFVEPLRRARGLEPPSRGAASPLAAGALAAPAARAAGRINQSPRVQSLLSLGQTLQRRTATSSAVMNDSPRVRLLARTGALLQPRPQSGGLPHQLRAGVEAMAGVDMSDVRVRFNSPEPAQLRARAFAQGREIHLGPGQDQHLPHEAWHVAQQKQGRVRPTTQAAGRAINDDPALEREADHMGGEAARYAGAAFAPPAARRDLDPGAPAQRILFGIGEEDGVVHRAHVIYAANLDRYAKGQAFVYVPGGADQFNPQSAEYAGRINFIFVAYGPRPGTLVLQQVAADAPGAWVEPRDRAAVGAPVVFNLAEQTFAAEALARLGEAKAAKASATGGEAEDRDARMLPTDSARAEGEDGGDADDDDDGEGGPSQAQLDVLKTIDLDLEPVVLRRSEKPRPSINLGEFVQAPEKQKDLRAFVVAAAKNRLKEEVDKGGEADPMVVDALRAALEVISFRPRKSGYSGEHTGSLRVALEDDGLQIEGRPAFEKPALDLPGRGAGQHRRHIVAWHTIKGAILNISNEVLLLSGKAGVAQLFQTWAQLVADIEAGEAKPEQEQGLEVEDDGGGGLEPMEDGEAPIAEEAAPEPVVKKPRGKPPKPPPDRTTLEGILTVLLSKLNSNVQNLWPGEGYENSLINTYQYMFREWATAVATMSRPEARAVAGKIVASLQGRVKAKSGSNAAFVRIVGAFAELLDGWARDDTGTDTGKELAQLLNRCADTFEVDFPHPAKGEAPGRRQEIAAVLLRIAGLLLDWSEQGSKGAKDRSAEALVANLDAALRVFMFPQEQDDKAGDEAFASGTGLEERDGGAGAMGGLMEEGSDDQRDQGELGWGDDDNDGLILMDQVDEDQVQRLRRRGVPNPGNTCYIASVLALIAANPDYLVRIEHLDAYPNPDPAFLHLMKATRAVLDERRAGRLTADDVVRYRAILMAAGWLGGDERETGRQQDAAEFLGFMLAMTHGAGADAIRDTRVSVRHESRLRDGDVIADHGVQASPILTLNGLRAVGDTRSLEQVFNENYDRDRPTHDEAGVTEHRYTLEGDLPTTFTLQVGRFDFGTLMARAFKLRERLDGGEAIDVPHQAADGERATTRYVATSFILHLGATPAGGHYIAYVREGGAWVCHNDDDVRTVSDEAALEKLKDAYLITYARE